MELLNYQTLQKKSKHSKKKCILGLLSHLKRERKPTLKVVLCGTLCCLKLGSSGNSVLRS